MRLLFALIVGSVVLSVAGTAQAASQFDGKQALLCTVHQLHECDHYAGCNVVPVATASDIRHLSFDFKAKTVQLEHWDAGLTSKIDRVTTIDQSLVVQGVDEGSASDVDGAGWTMTVNQRYGTMVMTVSGADVGFVGIGSCVKAN